jgi:hypothetical protein
VHARVSDHAGSSERLRWRPRTCCLALHRQRRHPGKVSYRGRDRNAARAALGKGLAVSAFPRYVPV